MLKDMIWIYCGSGFKETVLLLVGIVLDNYLFGYYLNMCYVGHMSGRMYDVIDGYNLGIPATMNRDGRMCYRVWYSAFI